MLYDHAWIESNIPHQFDMCLLDSVISYTDMSLVCSTVSHLSQTNPLSTDEGLGAITGVEYAAQAMAIHGVLVREAEGNPIKANKGYLVSVRDVTCHVDRLDTVDETIFVTVNKIAGDLRMLIYDFLLSTPYKTLLSGRASVIPDATTL